MVSSPDLGTSNLLGISALSAKSIWTVGSAASGDAPVVTLTERWDGQAWRVVPCPAVGTSSRLDSVIAMSARKAWAVGSFFGSQQQQALIEQRDGTQWVVASTPAPGAGGSALYGVTRVPAKNIVWAVGEQSGFAQTLIERGS